MKIVFLSAAFALLAGAADAWSAQMSVTGDASGTYEIEGQRNTIFSDVNGTYLSAEAYAEGVDAGRTTCATAGIMEIDYFFGNETSFGGHILFTIERRGNEYVVFDPTLFFDTVASNGDIIETYANFDTVTLAVTRSGCLPDGTLDLSVAFKGQLFSGMGGGPASIDVTGTADAQLIMRDMNDY